MIAFQYSNLKHDFTVSNLNKLRQSVVKRQSHSNKRLILIYIYIHSNYTYIDRNRIL